MRLLALVAFLLLASSVQACVKTVRWNHDPPYSMRKPDGQVVGLLVDLHRELLQRLGCRTELLEMPFARALAELQQGRLDLLPGTFDRPERRAYAHFSQPVLQNRNLLFVRKADRMRIAPGTRLTQLLAQDWRIGVQVGVVYGEEYAELLRNPAVASKLHRVPARRSLWLMLDLERVDAVPADELTGPMELQQLGLSGKIVASELVLSTEGAGTAISRQGNDAAFVQRFNDALAAMKADGSYAAVLSRYGLRAEASPR